MNQKESGPEPKIRVIKSDKCAGLKGTHILVHRNGENGTVPYGTIVQNVMRAQNVESVSLTQGLVSYCQYVINFGAISVNEHCAHLSLDKTQSKDKIN